MALAMRMGSMKAKRGFLGFRHECFPRAQTKRAYCRKPFGIPLELEDDVLFLPFASSAFLELDLAFANGADRADMTAEQAPYAFIVVALRLPSVLVPFHRLVGSIVAADDAAAASDALIEIDMGIDLIIAIERFSRDDILVGKTDQVFQMVDVLVFHIMLEAVLHVFDDPVTIFHDSRRDLKSLGAEQDELSRIDPVLDASDAGDFDVRNRLAHLLNETE